ncbi:MAG: hypothetical protein JWO08_2363 [Verrucomicrobiaceae bacterium]|nr:hypothetical protein [Verrucomicrobiaceae bacterium]
MSLLQFILVAGPFLLLGRWWGVVAERERIKVPVALDEEALPDLVVWFPRYHECAATDLSYRFSTPKEDFLRLYRRGEVPPHSAFYNHDGILQLPLPRRWFPTSS